MDGINKMSMDEYRVIPDNRKCLYKSLQDKCEGIYRLSLGDTSIITNLVNFGNMILTGLSVEAYNHGTLDLLTLYKGMAVYQGIIDEYTDEGDAVFLDNVIELFSQDMIEYSDTDGNLEMLLCNKEILSLTKL